MNLQTTSTSRLLGFIGAGRLAGAVMRGLLRSGTYTARQILASEPDAQARELLYKETGITVTSDNAEVAKNAQVLLLAVKPTVVLPVVENLADQIAGKLVLSLAAGTRLQAMERLADARFLRVMTNTPTIICHGAAVLARGTRTTDDDVRTVRTIFDAIGIVVEVDEEHIDTVTALAGSGPAFVYSVIEALAEGGRREGLPPDVALTLATQTVLGAASFAAESKLPPEALRRMVVTPGGTTAAGLAVMQKLNTSEGLAAAVEAATKRGRAMAEENT